MSVLQGRRRLLETDHEKQELAHQMVEALLHPNYVLDASERATVASSVVFDTKASDLQDDLEKALIAQSEATGSDYSANSLVNLGYDQHSQDPASLYSIYGGPEGPFRHMYGQGLPISLKRQFPTRAWNAPAISALGSGQAQPAQSSITPLNLSANRVQRFVQAMSHLMTESVDGVVTTAPNVKISSILPDRVHNSDQTDPQNANQIGSASARLRANLIKNRRFTQGRGRGRHNIGRGRRTVRYGPY